MVNTTVAYNELLNMSIIKASNSVYTATLGDWFWPIIFLFTLTLIAIKTENPAYVLVYSILGNFALAAHLKTVTHPIFYLTMVISLALVLWNIYASKKTE
jgi:hypothetical protein